MSELKCSKWTTEYPEDCYIPPNCPVCGGFIKWEGEIPICKKCGMELISLPETFDDGEIMDGYGKICPIPKLKKEKQT